MIGNMLIILHVGFCSVRLIIGDFITFESTIEYTIIYIRQKLYYFFYFQER